MNTRQAVLPPSFQSTGRKGGSLCGPRSGHSCSTHLSSPAREVRPVCLFSHSCQGALRLYTLYVLCPNAALFTFLLKLLTFWPLCVVRSRAPLTRAHTRLCVFLSTWSSPRRAPPASPAPGSPGPSSREGLRPSPQRKVSDQARVLPRGGRLLWESEVLFTHRDNGSPLEYTNHKF